MHMHSEVKVTRQGHPWRSIKFHLAMCRLLLSKHKKFGFDVIARFCSGVDKSQGGREKKHGNHFSNSTDTVGSIKNAPAD